MTPRYMSPEHDVPRLDVPVDDTLQEHVLDELVGHAWGTEASEQAEFLRYRGLVRAVVRVGAERRRRA